MKDIKRIRKTIQMQKEIIKKHEENGVVFILPDTCFISEEAIIGKDTIIYNGVVIEGKTIIGSGCEIGPDTRLNEMTVGDNTNIIYSVCHESTIGDETAVGPFAYIRPGCTVGGHVKVGDFVELKKSIIGDNTKISHLSYVGDAALGDNVNFSCGSITSNYDGKNKFQINIGDGAFVGCNTNLIAPVTVGRDVFIAAGSTITDDIPDNAFAIARTRQTNKENWTSPKNR